MATGIVFEFLASHHAVVVLLGLGAILFLPLARKDAIVEVVLATVLRKNHNFWDSHQLAESKWS